MTDEDAARVETGRASRRAFLAALGASGASALAGCGGLVGESEESEPVTVDIDPSRDVGTPGWPVGHGDAGNTNAVPKGAGVGDALALDWTVTLGGNAAAIPPVVRDGDAVTSNGWHRAYGMRADGTVAWQNRYPDGVTTVPPAFVGDVVVLVADGDLVALDPTDGSQVWTASLPGADTFGWLNGAGDTVVAATELGVAVLDAGDGTRRWYYQTGRETQYPPALADGVVYAGSEDTYVCAFDAASGTVRWRVKTDARVGPLAVAEGRVYVATEDGVLYRLDADDGTERWTATLDGAPSALAVTGGQVFVGVNTGRQDEQLRAVDADDGTLGWRAAAFSGSSLAVGVDALYAPVRRKEARTTLGVLDPATGTVRSRLQTPERMRVYRGPVVADGALYAAGIGTDGVLAAKVTSGN